MDFANFAPVAFAQAIQAQREHERGQRKWLRAWRQLERAQPQVSAIAEATRIAPGSEETPRQRAA